MAKRQNTSRMVNSKASRTPKRRRLSPAAAKYLPRPDFPLSPHVPTNRWYKVIRGKRYYFGNLANAEAALRAWLEVRDELESGLTPLAWRVDGDMTLADLANRWLEVKAEASDGGDIKAATFAAYYRIITEAVDVLGRDARIDLLQQPHFRKLARAIKGKSSPTVASKAITVVKMMFKWGHDEGLIESPIRFGSEFKISKKKEKRAAARKRGMQTYTAIQIRALLDAATSGVSGINASHTLRAIIFLGINCGMTQSEVAAITLSDIDLDTGIIDTNRNKTGATLTAPLWLNTLEAIQASLDERDPFERKPTTLLFVTRSGLSWYRDRLVFGKDPKRPGREIPKHTRTDVIQKQFSRLTDATGIDIAGAGFGHLRHTFRTVADEAGDVHAAMRIMGHDIPGINSAYIRDISVERLRAVTDYVRKWLFNVNG